MELLQTNPNFKIYEKLFYAYARRENDYQNSQAAFNSLRKRFNKQQKQLVELQEKCKITDDFVEAFNKLIEKKDKDDKGLFNDLIRERRW